MPKSVSSAHFSRLRGQQDVGGFDVAVQHAGVVGVVEGAGHVGGDGGGTAGIQRPGDQFGLQVRAVDVGHGQPQPALFLAARVDGDDVRMREPGNDIGLAQEALPGLVVLPGHPVEQLEGDESGQVPVVSEVHLTHSADADQPLDPIPGEGHSRPELLSQTILPIHLQPQTIPGPADGGRNGADRMRRAVGPPAFPLVILGATARSAPIQET
nr:hypothetical protein [Nocardia tengchongensis]